MVKIDCLHHFDELCSCAMDLDVRHLKLIVAVTEEKSVTRAGEVLHLTQSALSHQLREIEEKLGMPLFLRMNKKMILTQAGERLLRTARQVLDEMKRAEDHISQMATNRQGTLRISTECYTCYHWLPDVMKEFRGKFPGVEVKIDAEATHRPIQALLQGKLDLGIVSDVRRDKQLQYRPLFEDEFVAGSSVGGAALSYSAGLRRSECDSLRHSGGEHAVRKDPASRGDHSRAYIDGPAYRSDYRDG